MDIQKELELELDHLQKKYGHGKELHVQWLPQEKLQDSPFAVEGVLEGEVECINHLIYVYCVERLGALHTLRHEFFEYIIDSELIAPYVELYNQMYKGFEKAFALSQYRRKEALIEILVEREEESQTGDKKK